MVSGDENKALQDINQEGEDKWELKRLIHGVQDTREYGFFAFCDIWRIF